MFGWRLLSREWKWEEILGRESDVSSYKSLEAHLLQNDANRGLSTNRIALQHDLISFGSWWNPSNTSVPVIIIGCALHRPWSSCYKFWKTLRSPAV